MTKEKKNFNIFFTNKDLTVNKLYSKAAVKSLVKSLLKPIALNNSKALIFSHLEDYNNSKEIQALLKKIEYSKNTTLYNFIKKDFIKFNVEQTGFIVLTSQRYNAAFLFKEILKDKYEIYLKINSCLVSNVYEQIKEIFLINRDEEFYEYRPERRENNLANEAVLNITEYLEEYAAQNDFVFNIPSRDEIYQSAYQNIRQIAHEIKNQLSILDIYTKVLEKKLNDTNVAEPFIKSLAIIKSQIEEFKNCGSNDEFLKLEEKDIKDIITKLINIYRIILREKNNQITLIDNIKDIHANAFIDENKFLIVMGNIIKNAHESTKNDNIQIKLSKEKMDSDIKIKIEFINHGKKIKDKDKDKIFNSGFTTKTDGWGVGLGACLKSIKAQFGHLELTKSDDKETIFTLYISAI